MCEHFESYTLSLSRNGPIERSLKKVNKTRRQILAFFAQRSLSQYLSWVENEMTVQDTSRIDSSTSFKLVLLSSVI